MRNTGEKGVCIIVENESVPGDRRVWQEANTLAEAGYTVSVVCAKQWKSQPSRETLNGIEIYRHPTLNSTGLLGHMLEYAWALLSEFSLALRVYARTRFSVLQACNPPDDIFLIGLFFKLLSVRFIFDHHDLAPELCKVRFPRIALLHRLARLGERFSFRTADVAIATNESFREIAIARGNVRRDRTFVVKTCPDLTKVCFTPKPSLKEDLPNLVVYVGIMEPQDGLNLLLDSIDYLVNEKGRRDTLFALIGSGTEIGRLQVRIAERGLEPWVRMTGFLYGDELWSYLASADLAVSPDPFNELNDKLTMIKIFEYMAFGLPVVLYDLVEGRRSAGDAALYARNNDPVDFARQIERLLESKTLRQEMGSKGKARIVNGLNWEVEKVKLLAAYDTALDRKGAVRESIAQTAILKLNGQSKPLKRVVNRVYYAVKPWLPLRVRLAMRRVSANLRRFVHSGVWPIYERAGARPPNWPGWPEGKRFAFVLTHDVEGTKGLGRVERLMNLERKHGFRSSFNFVPEGEYRVSESTRKMVEEAGFEVGIHGLEHDGKLYNSKATFLRKAQRINEYLCKWNACGFRSPLMQHRLGWLHQLNVEYDCSTFDTDPFEPEPDGMNTIFPFWVPSPKGSGYVELPYTLPQDHTLFVVLGERTIDIWKRKLDWVAQNGGMALLNTHPDYTAFEGEPSRSEYPVSYYEDLLRYVRTTYSAVVWEATPREVARYFCANMQALHANECASKL